MKNLRGSRRTAGLIAVFVLGLLATPQAFAAPSASTSAHGFVSFRAFRAGLSHSTYATAQREGRVVASAAEFAQMRTYLQHFYAGVDVRTSFITNGSYFDCATIATQPSVLASGNHHVAKTPAAMPGHTAAGSSVWTTTGTNARGANVSCPVGTVPVQRATLQQLATFATVRAYLTRGHAPRSAVDTSQYRYAHAYQLVKNFGAATTISVWNPKVPTGAGGDDHSLSQQWVTGGSGTGLQTAEAGWTKDPGFSTKKPVYFTYFTADGYNTTGCYDLGCGFVQTDNSVALGAPVSPCCSTPTSDVHFTQYYFLTGGDWWLNVNGTYIGYYPTSVYNGGQMSKNATDADFGGEVNASLTTAPWPPMGSGKPAKAGVMKAAYQSSIEYITTKSKFANATLTTSATSPCYTIKYTAPTATTGTSFFFGGKGGAQGVC